MSFDRMNKPTLLKVAEDFGVEVNSSDTKADIIEAMQEEGVTWERYRDVVKDNGGTVEEEEPVDEPVDETPAEEAPEESKPEESLVLVKMTRNNATYSLRGYTFSKRHPFALVKSEDAEYLVSNVRGFQIASPNEAKEFYG